MRTVVILLTLVALVAAQDATGQVPFTFTESFNDTAYKDAANTTVHWFGDGTLSVDPYELEKVASIATSGNTKGVAVAGDYLFVAADTGGLRAYDLSDPNNPIFLTSAPQQVVDVALAGDLAYCATGQSTPLVVLDASNPTSGFGLPLGLPDLVGPSHAVAVAGDHAYVACDTGLVTVNVKVQTDQYSVSLWETTGSARDVAVSGNVAFVADWTATAGEGGGLKIVAIETPGSPYEIKAFNLAGANAVAVHGDVAYLATDEGLFRIIDYRETTPVVETLLTGTFTTVAVDGGGVYASGTSWGTSSLYVVTDRGTWAYDSGDTSYVEVCRSGDHLYAATGSFASFDVYRVSAPTSPPDWPGSVSPSQWTRGAVEIGEIGVFGDRLFVAAGEGAFQHVDISDPGGPVVLPLVGVPSGNPARALAVDAPYIFVAAGSDLWIAERSSSNTIYVVPGTSPGMGNIADVAVDGNLLAAVADSGLVLYDVIDPMNPSALDTLALPDDPTPRHVEIHGDLALVAWGSAGLQVIDISDPESISRAGYDTLKIEKNFTDVAVAGDVAFVANATENDGAFILLSILDPANPDSLSMYRPQDNVWAVEVIGDRAFIAVGSPMRVLEIDVSNPSFPLYLSSLLLPGNGDNDYATLAADGERLYVGSGEHLHILDTSNMNWVSPQRAQSLPIYADGFANAGRIESSAQKDSIRWELSTDGEHWYEALPGGDWVALYPGSDSLLWRATFESVDPSNVPWCDTVQVAAVDNDALHIDLSNSTAAVSQPSMLPITPGRPIENDGKQLTLGNCFPYPAGSDDEAVDGTITVTLKDADNNPVVGYPGDLITLGKGSGELLITYLGSEGCTDVNGKIAIDGEVRGAGWSVNDEVDVYVQRGMGIDPEALHNSLQDLVIVSADFVDTSCVNLHDIAHFVLNFNEDRIPDIGTSPPYRSDLYPDHTLNLKDIMDFAMTIGICDSDPITGQASGSVSPLPQPTYQDPNVLGIYTDLTASARHLYVAPFQPFTLELLLLRPDQPSGVGGWECRVEASSNLFIQDWTLHHAPYNIENEPDFLVGLGAPVPPSTVVQLATLTCFALDGETATLALHPATKSSFAPPQPGYCPGNVLKTLTPLSLSEWSPGGPAFLVNPDPVAIAERPLPTRFFLHPSAPNPSRGVTGIRYELPRNSPVRLQIHDIQGRLIRNLVAETEKEAGVHVATWDGTDRAGRGVASGIYLYKIVAGDYIQTRRLLILR